MQLKKLFILSAAALLSATPSKSTAQTRTWTTVMDYQFIPGYSSVGSCLAADAAGDVFAGGTGALSLSSESGLVRQTTVLNENQNGWSLSDESILSLPAGCYSTVAGLAFDTTYGDLYSCGFLFYPCTRHSCPGSYWYIRKSTPTGWTTVNTYQYAPGWISSGAWAMAADDSGNIFVVGEGQDANGVLQWLVRKGSNAGTTWALVDHFNPLGTGAGAIGIGFVKGVVGRYPDSMFALGWTNTVTGGKHNSINTHTWIVRRSTDDGVTWVTVDALQPPTGYLADPLAVCADGLGNIYVAGESTAVIVAQTGTVTNRQWTVRMSPAGDPGTWTTVDTYSYPSGGLSAAVGLACDLAGDVVVVGRAVQVLGSSDPNWLVRMSPAGGANWTTVDSYPDSGAYSSSAWGVVTDSAGNLLVTGEADFQTPNGLVSHWIVRQLPKP